MRNGRQETLLYPLKYTPGSAFVSFKTERANQVLSMGNTSDCAGVVPAVEAQWRTLTRIEIVSP